MAGVRRPGRARTAAFGAGAGTSRSPSTRWDVRASASRTAKRRSGWCARGRRRRRWPSRAGGWYSALDDLRTFDFCQAKPKMTATPALLHSSRTTTCPKNGSRTDNTWPRSYREQTARASEELRSASIRRVTMSGHVMMQNRATASDRHFIHRSLPTSRVPSLTSIRDLQKRMVFHLVPCSAPTLDAGRSPRLTGLRPGRKHSAAGRPTDAHSTSPHRQVIPLRSFTAVGGRFSLRYPPFRVPDSTGSFAVGGIRKVGRRGTRMRDLYGESPVGRPLPKREEGLCGLGRDGPRTQGPQGPDRGSTRAARDVETRHVTVFAYFTRPAMRLIIVATNTVPKT